MNKIFDYSAIASGFLCAPPIGSEIISQVQEKAFDWLDAPIKRVTGLDVPLPYAENLEKLALPQGKDIVKGVLSTLNMRVKE